MNITAEDSRELLATYRVSQVSNTYEYSTHLRAALDREAAFRAVLEGACYGDLDGISKMGVEHGRCLGERVAAMTVELRARAEKAEAERDAARVEAVAEAVAVIEALGTEWPHGWVPSHEAMLRIHALAQEPGA